MPSPAAAEMRRPPTTGRTLRASDVTHAVDGSPRLCGAECAACGTRIFPAAQVCPSCNSEEMKPLSLSGHGVLYAFSTVHVAPAAWETPYTIGYVDLPEGVRVFGKVEGASALVPDAEVGVSIEPIDDPKGGSAPAFQYWFTPRGTR